MKYDEYWDTLVNRVYQQNEILTGVEETFYRFACIYGENMVDGIQSYFERRIQEYPKDLAALQEHGFSKIAETLQEAKTILFGQVEITSELVDQIFDEMYEDESLSDRIDQELSSTYDALIFELEVLYDFNIKLGVENELFTE
ncbi:hypothetical protein [Gimesia aquarii]|uniref:DNA mimic protein DMP19 C-terminal domain-containing protein n=1 Tax=Gimesia aquarii TaxID=2527964 RepID=A0A517X115_9PLAN|nr:hypothetical protein [Gimesia aquarii]QDU11193.1 hypothetical protein V202x_46120 [Gimesia aquarii]